MVILVVSELSGAGPAAIAAETPIMQAGVDSLAATELVLRLRSLVGVPLAPTLIFEQPTSRSVTAHIIDRLVGEDST
eukprot:2890815-Prymnesium_polylepis.1